MNTVKKPKIFISYSHADEEWKDFIRKYFEQTNSFEIWDDRNITSGEKWFEKIQHELYKADIAVLLISPDFLNSFFINTKEIPIFLDRCGKKSLKIIPIIIASCIWEEHAWIEALQGHPKDNKPLNTFREFEEKFQDCPKIQTTINEIVRTVLREYRQSKIKQLDLYLNQKEQNIQKFEESNNITDLEEFKTKLKTRIPDIYWGKIEDANTYLDLIDNIIEAKQDYNFLEDTNEELNVLSTIEDKSKVTNNNIFLHFRQDKIEDNKYFVDIYARYKDIHNNKTLRDIVIEDINDPKSQQKFMQNFHQLRKNIPIHLILPFELYLQNFRLWKDTKELVEQFHPIYIHSDTRYTKELDEYPYMIEDEWGEEYKPDAKVSKSIKLLKTRESKYGIRGKKKKIGVCYKYYPTEEIISTDVEIAKIALWFQENSKKPDNHIKWINKNFAKTKLKELPDKLQECDYASLLWDDMSMLVDLKTELQS